MKPAARVGAALLAVLVAGVALAQGYDAGAAGGDLKQGQQLAAHIPWSELLGPLAPVALSPFFGLACLSGLSLLVSRGLLPENLFLKNNPVLDNPWVFASLLGLALITSLPRLTKVSKPLAQACDFLESYAGLVAMVVVQWVSRHAAPEVQPEIVLAGVGAVSQGAVLAAVSALNFVVIQTVRFVFEMLVWLSPIPLVDALFEGVNKLVCAGLLAVYAISPWAAFFANMLIFLVCLCLFRWARRKLVQFHQLLRSALARVGGWLRRRPRPAISPGL